MIYSILCLFYQISPGGCSYCLHQLYSSPSWLLWPCVHLRCCFFFIGFLLLSSTWNLQQWALSHLYVLVKYLYDGFNHSFRCLRDTSSSRKPRRWLPHSGQQGLSHTGNTPGNLVSGEKDSFYDHAVVSPRHTGLRSPRPSPQGGRRPCQPPTYLLSSAANPFCVHHALWHH